MIIVIFGKMKRQGMEQPLFQCNYFLFCQLVLEQKVIVMMICLS